MLRLFLMKEAQRYVFFLYFINLRKLRTLSQFCPARKLAITKAITSNQLGEPELRVEIWEIAVILTPK